MKNFVLFFLILESVFLYSCFAQNNFKTVNDMSSNNDLAVISYHVEERINMNFGGSIRTYDVPNLELITPKDLGKNNVRIITPKYAKVKVKAITIEVTSNKETKIVTETLKSDVKISRVAEKPILKKDYANIDVVDTYERIMDKGYKSVEMITKVADRHFFEGDMPLAAKWYTELFNNKTDLEAVYYYRFAKSLLDTGQTQKGNEMMQQFENKSL